MKIKVRDRNKEKSKVIDGKVLKTLIGNGKSSQKFKLPIY